MITICVKIIPNVRGNPDSGSVLTTLEGDPILESLDLNGVIGKKTETITDYGFRERSYDVLKEVTPAKDMQYSMVKHLIPPYFTLNETQKR